MNPQPPVTRMRMAARTSSAEQSAPAEYSSAVAGLRSRVEQWRTQLAATDWVPWAILGLAAVLRFFRLGIKPGHFVGAFNGWFFVRGGKTGFSRSDPAHKHGPCTFCSYSLS